MQLNTDIKSITFYPVDAAGEQNVWPIQAPQRMTLHYMGQVEHHLRRGFTEDAKLALARMFHAESGKPTRKVGIEGGFEAQRFGFMIKLDTERSHLEREVQVVFGYTEPCETVDAQTVLTFDRTIVYHITKMEGITGLSETVTAVKDVHILSPRPDLFMNRVVDGFTHKQSQDMIARMSIDGPDIMDLRSMTHARPKLFMAKDDYVDGWVERAVKAHLQMTDQSADPFDDGDDRLIQVISSQPQPDPERDTFLYRLAVQTDFKYTGAITLGEVLQAWDMDLAETMIIVPPPSTDYDLTEGLDDSVQAYIAYQVARACSAAMPTHGLAQFDFLYEKNDMRITNSVPLEQDKVVVKDAVSMYRELTPTLKALSSTRNGTSFALRGKVVLGQSAEIEVSLNGVESRIFRIPLWCSSLMSPQVTANQRDLDDNYRFFEHLTERLNTVYKR